MTNDLEHLDISTGAMSFEVGKKIVQESLPKLLKLYSKYSIKSTFFVLGSFAQAFPEAITMISNEGHEIASHGFSHEVIHGFDIMKIEDQIRHLKTSKGLLESISKQEVVSFRSPALRINNNTVRALEESGFLIDSSVSPKRLDFFLSYGSKNKWNWLDCPESPYFMSKSTPFKSGRSKIFEIPVSAFLFGFIGSTMRSSPTIFDLISDRILKNSLSNDRPVVFLFHPNELIDFKTGIIKRRSKNLFNYMVKDYLRSNIKRRNLGDSCYNLLEKLIIRFKNSGFEFITAKSFYNLTNNFKK